ncbi:MAG TPA: acetyl-CoA carboxylase biotin carboxyl carrier protein [Bacteroidia bacterium]|nr:acetyl-CoA carboxylase biotin carboxyl carrier protein [Bacteroidia bacterium]HNU32017.1 acetyl-CoA carboxylase biotin carboxyl carrier protein [Bacteroidia bacterium]
MNKKEIEELIKFVSKAGVSEVSIEQKDIKITIKNAIKEQIITMAAQAPVMAAPVVMPAAAPVAAPAAPKAESPAKAADESKYHTVKSPMIGTFYRTPSPDKPNFVNVGDEVKPGQIICIIEAMKLFNEIECDVKGKVVKVLVDHATPVEYDQPLLLIEPN